MGSEATPKSIGTGVFLVIINPATPIIQKTMVGQGDMGLIIGMFAELIFQFLDIITV